MTATPNLLPLLLAGQRYVDGKRHRPGHHRPAGWAHEHGSYG